MGYRIIKQYYEMTLNDTFENNNRGDKSKTIRRGYFMKYFLTILLVINGIFGSVFAQQYPVRLVPMVFPPYNVRLSDYALNSEPKLQLQVLMTDLLEPPHKTGIKFSLKFNNIQLNSEKQLINGSVETAYNTKEGNIIDLKSVGELLSELSDIFKKENPTEEDEKKYEEIGQQWEFYSSNIDDIGMSEEDKRKFERIKANMFHASLSKMTAEDRENASKAAQAGQKLFKKYEKEFDKLKDRNNLAQTNVRYINFNKLQKVKNVLYFVNGYYSFAPFLGPTNGRKDYWLYFDGNKGTHVGRFLKYFEFNPKETLIIYVDGASQFGGDQDFRDRFRIGQKFIELALKKDINLAKKPSAVVAHSEGVAYSAGIIEELYKNKAEIKEAVYLSADEGAEKGAYTNPNVPTYQIEYTYFDTDRDKGCIAHYDWVIGTHLRYKTYEGIKGITKFGITIDNKLNYADVHGASADPNIIDYLKILKQVNYTQNLNSEGKIFYIQQPAGKYLFWKIDNQFIDANHPQFDEKLGKINYNLKCK